MHHFLSYQTTDFRLHTSTKLNMLHTNQVRLPHQIHPVGKFLSLSSGAGRMSHLSVPLRIYPFGTFHTVKCRIELAEIQVTAKFPLVWPPVVY